MMPLGEWSYIFRCLNWDRIVIKQEQHYSSETEALISQKTTG